MRFTYLKNPDGTTSVYCERSGGRVGMWSAVVAELMPVDGGVVIMQGMTKQPMACRKTMIEASKYAEGLARQV